MPQPALFKLGAQLHDKLSHIARDGFRSTDRLDEGPLHFDHLGRPDRMDRLRSLTDSLVEPSPNKRPEPQRQRGPRCRQQIMDTLEAQFTEITHDVRRQT